MKFRYTLRLIFSFMILPLSSCGGDDTKIVIIQSDFSAADEEGNDQGASITYVQKSDNSIHTTTETDQLLEESSEN